MIHRSSARRLLPMLLLAAVCTLAPAAIADADELRFNSRFYEVTTTLDRDLAIKVAKHTDMVYAHYADQFSGFRSRQLQSHPLFVFETRQQYTDFLGRHDIDGSGSGGMFFVSPHGSGLTTMFEGQGLTRMLRTLRHEGFHQFAHSKIGPNLPQWANEGLAEYFAESLVVRNRLVPGQVAPGALHNVKAAIENDRYLPFEELLHLSQDQWNQRVRQGDSRLMYDQSWSIVHFLVHADRRFVAAFDAYLLALGRGIDAQVAFDQAFDSPNYQAFERAWKRYIVDLEPTPETTAAHRLNFLAEGLKLLHQRDVAIDTIEKLEEILKASQFRMHMSLGHGQTLEMRADQPEHFQPPEAAEPDRRGRESSIALIPAQDENLPPGIVVEGLKHTVTLQWRLSPDDQLISEVVYD